jgi:hypothetical protein
MSEQGTTKDQVSKRQRERKRFEAWMGKYWGGISLGTISTLGDAFEYRTAAAQTAWEVWMKFNGVRR